MTRASGLRSFGATGALLRVGAVAAIGVIGTASRTEAAVYYWQSSEPGLFQSQPIQPPRRQKVRRTAPKKDEKAAAKETGSNPQGPLIISVSIAKQQVKIYDDNGVFAEAPVSTGMPGHPTPMGVFSVIQKHKLHHSNIYSGAPMPYMQRITWSGVAMHAGVLPGYPASHGCIRMPTAFAMKMWNWTKMGARVFVTPGDIAMPASFSHPFLPSVKVAPALAELPAVESHGDTKADKGAPESAPTASEVKLELRSTVGQNEKPTEAPAPRDQTRTAEAAVKSAVIMTDAQAGPERDEAAGKIGAAKPDGAPVADANRGAMAAPNSEKAEIERNSVEDAKRTEPRSDQPVVAARADGDDARAERHPSPSEKANDKSTEPKPGVARVEPSRTEDTPKLDAPKPDEAPKAVEAKSDPAQPVDKSDDKTGNATDASAKPASARKDQTRLSEAEKPAVAKPEPPKRSGQIAVFISRKDAKLYVRQNFEPLFQVPITIASSDRPLGTHVFTAEVDKTDSNVLHWTVVSIPAAARAMRGDDGERVGSRRHKGAIAPTIEAKPVPAQNSPAEALDRITVPQDAMTRVAEAIATGGSIIVSDQGINQGETGEGTDFIVRLY
jgi:lipoprotein-anchoring transpeptidase ErfK/SrfK